MTASISTRGVTILICMAVVTPVVSLQPRSRVATQTSRHLYRVVNSKGRIGFIDETGRLVIGFDRLPQTTAVVGDFHDGRAVVYLKKEKGDATSDTANRVGYINETGKLIIPARFDEAHNFSEGLAYVQSKRHNAFVDRQGKNVISFYFLWILINDIASAQNKGTLTSEVKLQYEDVYS